jgi:hypothetical protein
MHAHDMSDLRFDPFGMPVCNECMLHWEREGDRLSDSFRAVLASGEALKPVKCAYFVAFHDGGQVRREDELAVNAAEDRPRSRFHRERYGDDY